MALTDQVVYGPQWRRLRPVILERDAWLCTIRGEGCTMEATQVDHIIPWRDGGALYDPDNLRASCSRCNTARSNRQKAREGWKRADTHITLIIGPPGAGKSRLAREKAADGDLIIDYDDIARALGTGAHAAAMSAPVMAARNAVLAQLRSGETGVSRAFVVSSNPNAEQMFPYHAVEVVDPGVETVKQRAVAAGRPVSFLRLIEEWYESRSAVGGPSREW